MKTCVVTSLFVVNFCLEIFATNVYHGWSPINELDGFDSHPVNNNSPASKLHDEVDILKLINVTSKDPGVSLVEGPINNYPAYKFRLPYGNVPLSNSTAVTTAMSSATGFTVVFLYRQQRNNLGTLLSVNSPGRLTPWFQLSSNAKIGFLSLKYRINVSQRLHQVDWSLPTHHKKSPLAAWRWLSVSLDFTTGIVRLDLDCLPSKFESLSENNGESSIRIPHDSLVYFRQEPGRKKKFLGSMQVAKVLPYTTQNRLWNCVHISEHPAPEHRKPLVR